MFFLRKRRRARLLATPLTDASDAVVRAAVPLYRRLPAALLPSLQGAMQVLLTEKHWEGCDGLTVTEPMRLTIAAQAALLQLRPDADHFPGLDTILVYPETFVVAHPREDEHGFVTEGEDELAGESWQRGVVILSWDDVLTDTRKAGDGYNVVLHEFAHHLEAEGLGLADATRDPGTWHVELVEEYEALRDEVERGNDTWLDPYGAEDETEFFAVVTEEFLECPVDLREAHPRLYGLMRDFYGIDPAAWRIQAEDQADLAPMPGAAHGEPS